MALLAHLSDLHLGRGRRTEERARALCQALQESEVDHVVVSGDITHRGRRRELASFRAIFAAFIDSHRVTVVPGNHDRLGDDVSAEIMGMQRVAIVRRPGLYLVCLDTTGEHNRSFIAGHGALSEADVTAVEGALGAARADEVVGLLMHHHPLPLPHDNRTERLLAAFGWSSGRELPLGRALAERLRGRCDLVLHGHRHLPSKATLFHDDARPLTLWNAGSSTGLGQVRMFTHERGRLVGAPRWVAGTALATRPVRELVTPLAA
jgi:Icc protein